MNQPRRRAMLAAVSLGLMAAIVKGFLLTIIVLAWEKCA